MSNNYTMLLYCQVVPELLDHKFYLGGNLGQTFFTSEKTEASHWDRSYNVYNTCCPSLMRGSCPCPIDRAIYLALANRLSGNDVATSGEMLLEPAYYFPCAFFLLSQNWPDPR